MLLPYATGFILGAGIVLGISFLYFQYKIFPGKYNQDQYHNLQIRPYTVLPGYGFSTHVQ